MTLEKRIKQLEYRFATIRKEPVDVPGTSICRVMVAKSLYKEFKLPEDKTIEGGIFWCVAFGAPWMRHNEFYGTTISNALGMAEEFLQKCWVDQNERNAGK